MEIGIKLNGRMLSDNIDADLLLDRKSTRLNSSHTS